ncbi:MAG: GTPase [Thermofilum sp. ex4484_82]|nr:MAG: GTPase [Thermofilum sp. ex4484_82]OYT38445.1 MAG: GTPase [Archaeoglobales archaeon ex4484_92]
MITVFVVGTAGCGKSTFTKTFADFLYYKSIDVIKVNVDPAVENLPYDPEVDIRDYISAKEVMDKYGLGPNGAIIAAIDLSLNYVHLIREEIEDLDADYVIIDTPGQVELFAFRKTGEVFTSFLCEKNCFILNILDAMLANSPSTFLSSLFLAEAIEFKLKETQINVLNKIDLLQNKELEKIMEWIDDPDKLVVDLQNETVGLERELGENLFHLIKNFLENTAIYPVSAVTMQGIDTIYAIIQQIVMGGEEIDTG